MDSAETPPTFEDLENTSCRVEKVTIAGLNRTKDSLLKATLLKFQDTKNLGQVVSIAESIQEDLNEFGIFKGGSEIWIIPGTGSDAAAPSAVIDGSKEDTSIPVQIVIKVKELKNSYGLFAGMNGPFPEAASKTAFYLQTGNNLPVLLECLVSEEKHFWRGRESKLKDWLWV